MGGLWAHGLNSVPEIDETGFQLEKFQSDSLFLGGCWAAAQPSSDEGVALLQTSSAGLLGQSLGARLHAESFDEQELLQRSMKAQPE
jgi:hypothetical protein